MKTEELAKILHESGREAVALGAMVNPNTHPKFLEWDELEEYMKEGRRIQAKYLLNRFYIVKPGDALYFQKIFKEIDEKFNFLFGWPK